ncbi:MAG: FeoA family protein [Sediminispirochaetaceae bacterium]
MNNCPVRQLTIPPFAVKINTGMKTLPLNLTKNGDTVRVVTVSGGRMARKKLMDLGIIPGERLKILRNDSAGPMLIGLYDSKVVVGSGLSQKVTVDVL